MEKTSSGAWESTAVAVAVAVAIIMAIHLFDFSKHLEIFFLKVLEITRYFHGSHVCIVK